MKKLWSVLICFCVCAVGFPGLPAEAQTAEEAEVSADRLEILQGLGLWAGPVSNMGRSISRAKFIEMADRLYGIPVEESDADYFTDVPGTHDSHDAISAAAANGLITGDGGVFEPDREILLEEAVKIMTSAQGFTPYAAENGGYPAGYMKCARQIGLISGMNLGDTLTYAEAVDLFYHAMESEVFVPIEIGGEKTSYEFREDVLSEFHHIYQTAGQVTATYDSTLYGESKLQKNRVRIDETEYDADYTAVSGLLGVKVDAYYRDTRNTDPEVLYLRPVSNARIVTIDSEDLISFRDFNFRYYDRGGRDVSARISGTAAFLYNGQAISDPADFSEELMQPDNGEVTLIDNGAGYEVVRVMDYQTVVVSAVSQNQESFYDKYTGQPVELQKGDKVTMVDKSGNEVPLSRLSEFDVASVAVSKGTSHSIRIIVSADAVEGEISQAEQTSDGRDVIYISKEAFELTSHLSDWLADQNKSLSPGDTGVFYLDHMGRVAAYELGKSSGSWYAYLIGAAKETFDTVLVKLMDQDGKLRQMQLSSRVRFGEDGSVGSLEAYEKLKGFTGAQRLMLVGTDSKGMIRNIDQPVPEGQDGPIMQTYDSLSGDLRYKDVSQCFGGLYNIDDNTLIFNVPSLATEASAEDEDYEVQKKAAFFNNDTSYTISAFITEKDVLVQDIVLSYEDVGTGGTGKILTDARMGVVQEVSTVLGDDGYPVQNLTVQMDGKTVDYKTDDSALLDGIARGDGVRVDVNTRGYIRMVEKLFDYQEGKVLKGNKAGGYDDINYIFYGQVVRKDGGVIQLEGLNEAGAAEKVNIRIRGNVYYCRELNNGDFQISSGTLNDIHDQKAMGDEASHVLIQSRYSDTKVVVIYD